MEPILSVKDLSVSFNAFAGKVHAVRDVNFDLYKGETLAIVGESGSGKSVTTKAILGILPKNSIIEEGEILYKGDDLTKYKEKDFYKIRGKEISLIFQDPMTSLNPVMTVGDQIAEAIKIHEGLNHGDALKKAEEMLEMVGIPRERAKEYPHQFSGGMKQRVVIAIALSCTPGLLIADEPTTALDVTVQAQIVKLLKRINEEKHTAILFISHDLSLVRRLCGRVAVMQGGRIAESGRVEEVYANPQAPYTKELLEAAGIGEEQ